MNLIEAMLNQSQKRISNIGYKISCAGRGKDLRQRHYYGIERNGRVKLPSGARYARDRNGCLRRV